jgi:hypothetical protein
VPVVCRSCCVVLSGPPVSAAASWFLGDLCGASPLLVRESPSLHTRRKQNVSEKGPFFATTFSRPFKDQGGVWRSGTSFGLNDLEALMNVAFEAKEWITAHDVKR